MLMSLRDGRRGCGRALFAFYDGEDIHCLCTGVRGCFASHAVPGGVEIAHRRYLIYQNSAIAGQQRGKACVATR